MMQTHHIAVLVQDLEAVAQTLPKTCTIHPSEDQPAEGTRERYVTFGGELVPSLLLIQAVTDGPYARAFEKRGPGLQHIGCICGDIKKEISVGSTGRLLLHPVSLRTRDQGVVWLCRPGVPFLVELMESPDRTAMQFDRVTVRLPRGTHMPSVVSALFANLTVEVGDTQDVVMTVGGVEVLIDPCRS